MMKVFLFYLFALFYCPAIYGQSSLQCEDMREQDIQKIIDVIAQPLDSAESTLTPVFDHLRLRPEYSGINDVNWKKLTVEMKALIIAEVNNGTAISLLKEKIDNSLTNKEIYDIASFFRSNAGQKYLKIKDSKDIVQTAINDIQRIAPNIKARFNELIKKLPNDKNSRINTYKNEK